MKIEQISQKTIRDYLLGNLDAATVEHLDELSVTSQDIADRITVEQYEMIDDWVAGRMTSSERASFELALSRSPTLREKAEFSRSIAAASRDAAVVERPVPFFTRLFAGFPRLAFGFAAVAVLLGIVTISVLVFQDRPDEVALETPIGLNPPPVSNATVVASPEPSSTPGPTQQKDIVNVEPHPSPKSSAERPKETPDRVSRVIALNFLPPTRSSNEIRTLRIQPDVEYLVLSVQTEADPEGKLLLEIGDPSSEEIDWRSASVMPVRMNGRATLRVRVPVRKLAAGLRAVRLRDADGSRAILDEHGLRIIR